MKEEIAFDVSTITVSQLVDLLNAEQAGNLARASKYYAKVCTALPKAWGAHDSPAVFENMTQAQMNRLSKAWNEATAAALTAALDGDTELPDGIEYDLDNVKAADIWKLRREFNRGNIAPIADILTRVVSACPAAWGDPSDAKTYQNLPYYGVFAPFVRLLINDVSDTEKNAKRRSIS